MASKKAGKPSKPSFKNPNRKPKPLGAKTAQAHGNTKSKKKMKKGKNQHHGKNKTNDNDNPIQSIASPPHEDHQNDDDRGHKLKLVTGSAQLRFFFDRFQSANGLQLSSLELESIKGIFGRKEKRMSFSYLWALFFLFCDY